MRKVIGVYKMYIFNQNAWSYYNPTTEWLNVNSPGWSEAEPGVRNAVPSTVRETILKREDTIISDGRNE